MCILILALAQTYPDHCRHTNKIYKQTDGFFIFQSVQWRWVDFGSNLYILKLCCWSIDPWQLKLQSKYPVHYWVQSPVHGPVQILYCPPCFPAFCWSTILTSCYIFQCFFNLFLALRYIMCPEIPFQATCLAILIGNSSCRLWIYVWGACIF